MELLTAARPVDPVQPAGLLLHVAAQPCATLFPAARTGTAQKPSVDDRPVRLGVEHLRRGRAMIDGVVECRKLFNVPTRTTPYAQLLLCHPNPRAPARLSSAASKFSASLIF